MSSQGKSPSEVAAQLLRVSLFLMKPALSNESLSDDEAIAAIEAILGGAETVDETVIESLDKDGLIDVINQLRSHFDENKEAKSLRKLFEEINMPTCVNLGDC